MATYKDQRGRWHFRRQWTDRSGKLVKISGTPRVNTAKAAEAAERRAIEDAENPKGRAQTTTFSEFWADRYLPDWCGPENRAGTVQEKRSIFQHHLQPAIGDLALADITTKTVQRLKASLRQRKNRYGEPISPKTIDNILTVLAHALTYAEDISLIEKAPKVRLYGAERPEPKPFTFAQLDAFLAAARGTSDAVYVASLLAADAGLRIGEIFALDAADLNFTTRQIRVDESRRKGVTGTTKSGRVRHVPMTDTLYRVLRTLAPKQGGVVRHQGQPVTETYLKHAVYRVCATAGLEPSSWHTLRHTYATHAARFGVSSWALQSWLGHSSVTMTEKYVTLANRIGEIVPEHVIAAGKDQPDPERRALVMLGARSETRFATPLQPMVALIEIVNDNDDLEVGGTGIEPATRAV